MNMTWTDFFYIFRWWLLLFITGLVFLPLITGFFSRFTDKGYAFAKILGVILVSYISFVLGTLKIAPFTPLTIYLIFIFSTVTVVLFKRNTLHNIYNKHTIGVYLLEELLFFSCLLAWSYVRGSNPDIYGLEKYMDFGFINSIIRTTYFPPKDMWYTPLPINYYYFGHLITAVLTKASAIPSYITFNLMIATLFALSLVESFSLGTTLLSKIYLINKKTVVRIVFGGLLIACLVTLAGNLHIMYAFFKPYEVDKPVPIWNLQFSLLNSDPCHIRKDCTPDILAKPFAFPNSYWYPNATRFIYHTIHEFPIYSWVVADLHGHVLDIPVVLLTIAILYSLLVKSEYRISKSETNPNNQKINRLKDSKFENLNLFRVSSFELRYLLLIGFLLAVMYMTNAWDGLTYFLLTFFIFCFIQWNRIKKSPGENTTNNPILQILPINKSNTMKHYLLNHSLIDLFISLFVYMFIILLTYLFFSLPFSLNFDPSKIVSGIGVVGVPSILLEKKADLATGLYGYDHRKLLMKIIIPDHCRSLMSTADTAKVTTQYNTRKIGPFLFEPDHCQRSPWWQLLILYGFFYFFVLIFIRFLQKKRINNASDIFVILLIITSTILIIIPEFLYMKDIYPDHYRANTMFKLVFQSFIMLSIASGYIILRTISKNAYRSLSIIKKTIYFLYFCITLILLTLVFIYPYFAITSYYNGLKTYLGLDGINYLKNKNSGDYEATRWLNNYVYNQPVTLEAQGDSYTDYERISANTGLPTVLGWYVHEWLWRGADSPVARTTDVKNIYESKDIKMTMDLIKKYKISYIVIGSLETQKYPNLYQQKFKQLGTLVFHQGTTAIYKIK